MIRRGISVAVAVVAVAVAARATIPGAAGAAKGPTWPKELVATAGEYRSADQTPENYCDSTVCRQGFSVDPWFSQVSVSAILGFDKATKDEVSYSVEKISVRYQNDGLHFHHKACKSGFDIELDKKHLLQAQTKDRAALTIDLRFHFIFLVLNIPLLSHYYSNCPKQGRPPSPSSVDYMSLQNGVLHRGSGGSVSIDFKHQTTALQGFKDYRLSLHGLVVGGGNKSAG